MRKRTVLLSALVVGMSFSGVSQAEIGGWMEQSLVAVCKASLSNRVVTFNNTMKDYRVNGQRILPNLMCNGEEIQEFALNRGADKTAAHIQRYLPGTVTIQDIAMNQPVQVWFEE
ncbi:DUF3718 domain-containing protein [Ferrimonas balearica]|uniref:DUF3718 domain-containing protein n=1 Tax=Ferrimonas balearica TaxID=44012 RepID=UPI001C9920F2|nr:DUF3718 domain-containing protein [Ferrimonas balearica]MBY5990653.1 DUF3718 domain-containing protein [Ferrimonas balearica]